MQSSYKRTLEKIQILVFRPVGVRLGQIFLSHQLASWLRPSLSHPKAKTNLFAQPNVQRFKYFETIFGHTSVNHIFIESSGWAVVVK